MSDAAAESKTLVRRFLDAPRSGDVATTAQCFDLDRYYSHSWGGLAEAERLYRELVGEGS